MIPIFRLTPPSLLSRWRSDLTCTSLAACGPVDRGSGVEQLLSAPHGFIFNMRNCCFNNDLQHTSETFLKYQICYFYDLMFHL